jgi:glycosyltransferase involved in cell wall biosynthesis
VLEAMASETPTVVSRIAPFTEYLQERDCAWADPLDVGSIAAAMRRVCEPDTAAEMRRAGRAVCARFSWAASAQRHLEIYRRSIGCQAEAAHA